MQAQLYTVTHLAVELKRDRRALSKVLEHVAPAEVSGSDKRQIRKYYMADVVNALIERGEELDLTQERARQAKEQADKLALENKQSRSELVAMGDVVREVGRMIASCKARLLSIPTALSTYLVNIEDATSIESQLRDAISEALTELEGYDPSSGDGQGTDVAVEAPAKANGKRVGGRRKKAKPRSKRATRPVAN